MTAFAADDRYRIGDYVIIPLHHSGSQPDMRDQAPHPTPDYSRPPHARQNRDSRPPHCQSISGLQASPLPDRIGTTPGLPTARQSRDSRPPHCQTKSRLLQASPLPGQARPPHRQTQSVFNRNRDSPGTSPCHHMPMSIPTYRIQSIPHAHTYTCYHMPTCIPTYPHYDTACYTYTYHATTCPRAFLPTLITIPHAILKHTRTMPLHAHVHSYLPSLRYCMLYLHIHIPCYHMPTCIPTYPHYYTACYT